MFCFSLLSLLFLSLSLCFCVDFPALFLSSVSLPSLPPSLPLCLPPSLHPSASASGTCWETAEHILFPNLLCFQGVLFSLVPEPMLWGLPGSLEHPPEGELGPSGTS